MKHSSPLPAHPPLLATYLDEANPPTWAQFRNEHRDAYLELCAALNARQRGLCAFCEIDLVTSALTDAREVEHWRPKSLDAGGSTQWTFGIDNLQLGCLGGSKKHPAADEARTGDPLPGPNLSCGAIKGNLDPGNLADGIVPYRPEDLPEFPSMFNVAEDGTLRPIGDCARFGFDAARLWKTIDFLGLDCTRLKNARRAVRQELDDALIAYVDTAEGANDDERFDNAFALLALDTRAPAVGSLPRFVTTIRSFFGRGLDPVLFPKAGWSVGQ